MSSSTIHWIETDQAQSARWFSSADSVPPPRVVIADDRINADTAFRLASEGTALLWRGDFQNCRQLLQAMARRIDRAASKPRNARKAIIGPTAMVDVFNAHRQAQAQRARTLGQLLIPFFADYGIALRRAPDVRAACEAAFGAAPLTCSSNSEADVDVAGADTATMAVMSLRTLHGAIGAYEWRKKGVAIDELAARIYPHYGVFAPIRNEYVGLVANQPLPVVDTAFDIGTGTGVLAAVLARRGIRHIVATDMDHRALVCARDNLTRLNYLDQVEVVHGDLFPIGKAGLIVCNPPWLPARPSSPLEHAVYDPDSRMLRGFINGLSEHLQPAGEGWLILSDLAEHLGLRSRSMLLTMIGSAGLVVLGRTDVKPHHPKIIDCSDLLHAVRRLEVTSLWRLGVR